MLGFLMVALSGATDVPCEPGALLLTVDPSYRYAVKLEKAYYDGNVRKIPVDLSGVPGLEPLLQKYGLTDAQRLIPMEIDEDAMKYNLDLLMYLHFSDMDDPGAAAEEFSALPSVLYAEPNLYMPILDTLPDDPRYSAQWHLNKIDCPAGWDIAKGDGVIVGAMDTGLDWDHEDIVDHLWVNPGEDINGNGKFDYPDDINGVDDDSNGYIDDIIGFDMSDMDWDPTPNPSLGGSYHGTHVYGIMAATTNNGIGVAGEGWNSKIMAFKCDVNNGGEAYISISAAISAIYYLGYNGGHITNHSYGSYSQTTSLKSALQYVYDSKNVNNYGAAGNDSQDRILYPAGFGYFVVAVASTNVLDKKSSFSNYGTWVDVSAPGSGILSTLPNDQYGNLSGTSMASPSAAGVGAVIRSFDVSGLTAPEVDSAMFHGCVDIDSLNPGYEGKLGWGRVDLYNSLMYLIDVQEGAPRTTDLGISASPSVFSGDVRVSFSLPQRARVDIALYDAAGKRVATLASGTQEAGTHSVVLNGKGLAQGVYFIFMNGQAAERIIKVR